MKIASTLLVLVLFLTGCVTAHKPESGDPFSGRAWVSKFEACMCEIEAPIVFNDGVAYLYNRAHGSLRRVGEYEIKAGSAIFHDYRGVKTQITCNLLPDGTMLMSVEPLIREMGWVGFRDKELMPWSLLEVNDRGLFGRAKKLITKEKNTEPNQ